MEGPSGAGRSPMGAVGWASFEGLLSSCGGVTAPGALCAGFEADRLSASRSETAGALAGALLHRIVEALRRIAIARITPAAMEIGTAAGLMRSRTERTASMPGA